MTQKFDKLVPGRAAKLNLLADVLLVAFIIALRDGQSAFEADARPLTLIFVGIASWIFASAAVRLYSPCTPRSNLDNLLLGLMAAGGVTFAVYVVDTILGSGRQWRFDAWEFFVPFWAVTSLTRLGLFHRLRQIDPPLDDVLIIGTGALGMATYQRMRAVTGERRRVIGFLRFEGEPDILIPGDDVRVLGEAKDLPHIVLKHPVSEVYVAGRLLTQGQHMQQVVSVCEDLGLPFALPLHSLRFERATLLSSSKATDGYLHYLTNKPRPAEIALKRLLDIAAAATGLLLLSPLLIGVAVAIKLTSKGPIFFKQVRVGMHGAHFSLLKFRSMVINAEEIKERLMKFNEQTGPVFKLRNDPRITGIGRFIRKYSIDELPQLINILRGDMSVVGPRPAIPSEVAQYKPWQRRRLSVRPGLTCYWQVGGRNQIGFDEWMQLDLRYIDNWSLAVDFALILQTVPVVVTGKGAS